MLLLAAALLLPTTRTSANPISSDALRLRQVPTTRHVQITFGVDTAVETLRTPLEARRDGALLKGGWTTAKAGFTANTGSGLMTLDATQICDCDVGAGTHEYTLTLEREFQGKKQTYTRSAKITVEKNYNPALDAGTPKGDVQPWEIPEPSKIQGLDCKSACSGVAPDSGGGTAGGQLNDRGGCSWGGARQLGSSLGLLVGLFLLSLALRRR
jgi:hypothetical protein